MSVAQPRPVSAWASIRLAAADIKLAHSVFALPFAILAAVLARPEPGMDWGAFALALTLVVLCMIAARTWAMLVNRLADRAIDARNARTARRLVASGTLPARRARAIAFAGAGLFVGLCGLFWLTLDNPWPVALSVPVLAWIAAYSYAKRFTALCHVMLGSALAISPLAAALAVHPPALASTPALWLLAGMVLCWVGGFDIIYALQDVAFDQREGLHSVPSRLGVKRAIVLSRVMHATAWCLLAGAWWAEPRFGAIFGLAVLGVAALLIAEHAVLARRGEAGLEMAFFTINGVVSCVLGLAGVADVLV